MPGKILKVVLIFKICFFSQFLAVKSITCEKLENKIKSYEDKIERLKISLEEYELIFGKTEDMPDECNESLTCPTCLWEKKNSGCGWCVLRNRCSMSKNCPENNASSNVWITGRDKCPKIRAVIPHIVPASTSKMLQVIIPHLPDYEAPFICSFEVYGKTLVTKGWKFDRGITCASPHSDSLPKMAVGDDYIDVKLSVRTPNGPNFASTSNFTIYDCSRYKTCSECSDSVFPCAWCVEGQRCSDDVFENCKNEIMVFSKSVTKPTTRQGPGYCPRIANNNESANEILIPYGSKKKISVKVENVMIFHAPATFTCKVKGFQEVTAQLLGDTLYCDDINLRLSGRQPIYNLSFSVYWNGEGQMDNPRNLHVIVYHCERMAQSCGECIDLPERYNCGWCEESDSCCVRDQCSESVWVDQKGTCKRPEITSIYPSSGIFTAKTNLTIEGVNLAKEFKDIDGISVIDSKGEVLSTCVPYEHLQVRHSKIVCLLDTPKIQLENNGTVKGYVEVKFSKDFVAISEKEYTFVNPVIRAFSPAKGMESGGTVLKITGYHLDAGNEVKVYIGDLPCRVISRDKTSIQCISSPVLTNERGPKSAPVRVIFDGEERSSASYFFYAPDPSVHFVKGEHDPQGPAGTPRGGDLIIVEGVNFDNVPSPYIYVIVDGTEYIETCTVVSETLMECSSPIIPAEALNFCEFEGYLPLHYGFKMGDTESVQNISKNTKFEMYKLYPEPYVLPFTEEGRVKAKFDYLTIQGKYLDNLHIGSDYTVTIGDEECLITSLSDTQLTCKVPYLKSTDFEENRLPQVQVKIRGLLEYFVGFLRVD